MGNDLRCALESGARFERVDRMEIRMGMIKVGNIYFKRAGLALGRAPDAAMRIWVFRD